MFRCNVKRPSLHALLVVLLCLCTYLQSTARLTPLQGKEISISVKKSSLSNILNQISKKSGITIYFVDTDLAGYTNIDYDAKDKQVVNILAELFKGRDLLYEVISEKNIAVRKTQLPQERSQNIYDTLLTVSGRVVNDKGDPIIGATVILKGNTRQGTTTNTIGEFVLKDVAPNASILVSSVSFLTEEVAVKGRRVVGSIEMKEFVGVLDETIVIGYGQSSKRIYTGNVSSVKAEDIEKQPVNNPLYALQGRVPGLQIVPTSGFPGAPINVQIRGRNTLNPSNKSEPLYIVDGLPYGNKLPFGSITVGLGALGIGGASPFNFLNPNDIESIDILKDADATSIYGSRGANGVILITTKKGKVGDASIDINVQSGFSAVPKKLDLLDGPQYIEMRKEALKNDGRLSRLDNPSVYAATYPELLLWDQRKSTDWQKVLIGRVAQYTDLQASVSGGTQLVQYLVGGNYHKEGTVFPGESYDQKASGHFSLTGTSYDKRFRTSLSATYMINNSNYPEIDLTSKASTLAPNAPDVHLPDGNLNWAPNLYTGQSSWNLSGGNPLAYIHRVFEIRQSNFLTSAEVSYRLFSDIFLKTIIGYSETRGNAFKGTPSTAVDPYVVAAIGDISRTSSYSSNNVRNWNFNPLITYNKKIGSASFDFLLGAEFQSTKTQNDYIDAVGFTNDNLLKSLNAAMTYYPGNSSSQYKYNALFARVSFNGSNKYLINLNARRDGSSRFGPNRQFGTFGSVGAAWIFSEESFIKSQIPILSFGKLRMSYGTSGNDGNADYMYLEQYAPTTGDILYQGARGYGTQGLFNSNYGWESTKKIEAGLDLGFWKDNFLLQTSFYRNRSQNQLINYSYPSMAGFGNVIINFPALIQNTGIELNLNVSIINRSSLTWRSSINLTVNRNKLIEFEGLERSPYASQFEIGKPFSGVVRAFSYAGVDASTGQYQFTDIDGKITADPTSNTRLDGGQYLRIMTDPKYYGGWQNNFTFKGFSLDFLFQYSKQMGRNPVFQLGNTPGGVLNRTIDVLDRWQNADDVASIQRYTTAGSTNGLNQSYSRVQQSNMGYVDASFIRLKNVSMSYNFSKSFSKKLHLKDIILYVQSQNLWTRTPYKGYDPETQSLDYLPPLRVVTFGFKLKI